MRFTPILKAAESVTGGPPRFEGMRTYFATADVDGSDLLSGTQITYDERPSRANLIALRDDVLFAKMKSTDKVVHLNGQTEAAVFSTGFFNLRARRDVLDPRFLFWFLRSPLFNSEKDRRCTGATQKALTLSGLKDIRIPLLDGIKEQKRVASILDKVDSIRRKRKSVLGSVDNLMKSEFVSRFGTPMSNSRLLPTAPIKLLGKVVTGNTPPRKDLENYGDEIEWIKSDNINTPSHFLTTAAENLSGIGRRRGRTVPANSTLVTCIAGSPSAIGNAAIADREVAFNQQINAVIPNDQTDPFFLYCQILVAKSLIQATSTKSMKGMVSKGKFQEIEFLRPLHDDQVEFGKFFIRTIEMAHLLEADWRDAERLFGSLVQQAFRGEL